MTRLPTLSYRHIKKALERAGFAEHPARGKGSHRAFIRPDDPTQPPVIVPYHKTIAKGTLNIIIKHAGFTTKQFLDLL